MPPPTTISQPPEPPSEGPSRLAAAGLDPQIRQLRAEVAASDDGARKARLLLEVAELEERAGDESGAARDYLAAHNADVTFRAPVEGLARLLEKRRSLTGLGKAIDALVQSAATPDEKVSALVRHAMYLADVSGDPAEAVSHARQAAEIEGASVAERASAWLSLEVLAGRAGDGAARELALRERIHGAWDPTWRALLLVDRARLAVAGGDVAGAREMLEQARSTESQATWTASSLLVELVRDPRGAAQTDEERGELEASTLEAAATLVLDASVPARADALGIPRWAREPARLVDACLRAAEARRNIHQLDRAASILDRGLLFARALEGADGRLAEAAVSHARTRVAEQMGDTATAAQLAEKQLTSEKDPGFAAAHAMRLAEHAASAGDKARALEALTRAVESDPGSLPARALQLDMLADGGDVQAFARELEAFADYLATDGARARAFVLTAYVRAVQGSDVPGARTALDEAAIYGTPPATLERVARMLASIAGDSKWHEEATERLFTVAATAGGGDAVSLGVELLRARHARGEGALARATLRELASVPAGAWLARVLQVLLPQAPSETDSDGSARAAVDKLAALEADPDLARAFSFIAALRAHEAGDVLAARKRLRELAEALPSDALVASYLADLDRAAGDHAAAAATASSAAAAVDDMELAGALRLEAAFERWRNGDRRAAVDEMLAALPGVPDAAEVALQWASWGVDPDSLAARREAIARAGRGSGDPRPLALERFATEIAGKRPDAAATALAAIDPGGEGDLTLAAALGRVVWSGGDDDDGSVERAIERVAASGPAASLIAAAERVRLAREAGTAGEVARAASQWFDAGGGLTAALEWLAAAVVDADADDEVRARLAIATCLAGDAREATLASAALVQARAAPGAAVPLVVGQSAAVRLTNLELAPPGADPRRRAAVLTDLEGSLGDDARVDAIALAGWSLLATSDTDGACAAFEHVAAARPSDLAAWEGLRSCGELTGAKGLQARAAAELGARCRDGKRGAAFWEEAALLWLDLGADADADRALEASFERDASRAVGFDRLFRRVRARKDNDKLLGIIRRRLEVIEEPAAIQKLYWEQARVLREKGDQDGALAALGQVTMLDPDHVGALALLGEINIRRGKFEEAAASLGRLATLDAAPAKNRVTAGVAAVDLFEKKLERPEDALRVLVSLHEAGISTLPVRERLARAAARTGAWQQATAILEELMLERPEPAGRIEAARLAMAIHRDRLQSAEGAAAAIAKLLEEAPADAEALDMLLLGSRPPGSKEPLLRRGRDALTAALQGKPGDVEGVALLARIAVALGDQALEQAALGALASLDAADAGARSALARLSAGKPRTPSTAVPEATLRAILAPGDAGPIADLFVLLGPTLAEALGPNPQACGVGRKEKVDPRSGLALRNEIATWAGAFGIHELDLYVGGKDPLAVLGVPGDPPALIVGPEIQAPLSPATRARVARELLGIVRGTSVLRSRDEVSVAAIVVAACNLADVRVDHPPYAVLAEIERLVGKAIPRKVRKAIADACRAIAASGGDARAWRRHALASQDRIAAIASGDPSEVLKDASASAGDGPGEALARRARTEELLSFVLSPQYLSLRRSLGLEGEA